jgi:hypothetical protein
MAKGNAHDLAAMLFQGARTWLANVLLDVRLIRAALAIAPCEVRAEKDRLRGMHLTGPQYYKC